MMHSADVVRIDRYRREQPPILMGWVIIVVITTGGFAALAYAIGKWAGMQVCR